MEIRELTTEEWQALEEPFQEHFGELPPEQHATFYGVFDDGGELKGYILNESVRFMGQVHLMPGATPSHGLALIRFARDAVEGQSVATVASEERFGRLFETLGLARIDGDLYRRG